MALFGMFVFGAVVGMAFGVFVMCLAVVAGDADREQGNE